MRHGLLMTAVATVTVPGVLAVLGVVGHDHVTARAGIAMRADTATAGSSLPGPFPGAPATARAGVRNDVAAQQRAAGGLGTVFSRFTARREVLGLHLLNRAADAGLSASYAGTEQISQSGVDGTVLMTSQVWHQAGGPTVVRTSAGTSSSAPATAVTSGSPEGVFGVTKALVALLGHNYVAAYGGGGTVAGRPAAVVAVYHVDGALAARYWLDRSTMLPLRRELFGSSGRVLSEGSFTEVSLDVQAASAAARADSRAATTGAATTGAATPGTGQAGTGQAAPAWVTASSPAAFLASLSDQGWPLPAVVSGGLPLYTAASAQTGNGEAVDLEYSDGLYVVSMFVQRGNLAASLPGWQPVRLAGQQAFVYGRVVAWARAGFVYTLIADAPPATVSQVIAAVPGSSGSNGVLDRVGRGLARLVRLANPFG